VAGVSGVSSPFVHRLRVRYHECDAQGVVFFANYFAFFDITLTELWRVCFGSYDEMVASGYDVVVAEATASYRTPARFDDEIDVEFSVVTLGTTSMTSDVEIRRDGESLVTGRLVHVWVDPKALTKLEIPDHARDALAPYMAQAVES
jgi:acyl-CoA thioester hydrolase